MAADLVPSLLLLACAAALSAAGAATWCVVRSDASEQTLQTALDYACAAGADCAPLQPSGLCYLPNTLQAHASYAFNSYYQRRANAPGSCAFSGAATVATTDPSYGSCTYPSSPRNAGGGTLVPPGVGTPSTPPITTEPPPPPFNGGMVGTNPGMGPAFPDPPTSEALKPHMSMRSTCYCVAFLLVFSLIF